MYLWERHIRESKIFQAFKVSEHIMRAEAYDKER